MAQEPAHTFDAFRLEPPPGAYGEATCRWPCDRGRWRCCAIWLRMPAAW